MEDTTKEMEKGRDKEKKVNKKIRQLLAVYTNRKTLRQRRPGININDGLTVQYSLVLVSLPLNNSGTMTLPGGKLGFRLD